MNKTLEINNKIRTPRSDKILSAICYVFAIAFAAICLYPFLIALSASFTDEISLAKYGYQLIPSEFSLAAYELLFETDQIYQSYMVSIFVTVVGTGIALVITSMLAYPLSTGRLKYGRQINFFVYFTMLFNGGLVANYMLISRYLGLKNTIWVLILPMCVNAWNMFLLRNFFSSIPKDFAESARIDGASDMCVMRRIILPLSLPALATIGLFYALAYWNNWYLAMLYIDTNELQPLQMMIMKMLRNAEFLNLMATQMNIGTVDMPTNTSKMATAMVTIGPIVLCYPFAQKYFTSGIMVGGVKG